MCLSKKSVAAALFFVSNLSHAAYTLVNLGAVNASAINNSGQIVGTIGNSPYIPFIISSEKLQNLALAVGMTNAAPISINDFGVTVGMSTDSSGGNPRPTLWRDGQTINLGVLPGMDYGAAKSVNNSSQIVGYSGAATSYSSTNGRISSDHATLWSNGGIIDLGTGTQKVSGYARAINDNGTIIGSSLGANGYYANIWVNGLAAALHTPQDKYSWAESLNNAEEIVGWVIDPINWKTQWHHAALWNNGTFKDLGTLPNMQFSRAFSINKIGKIAGESAEIIVDSNGNSIWGKQRAVLWENESIVDLNNFMDANTAGQGWILTQAIAINDSGSILVSAQNSITGISGSFLMSPSAVPESASCILLVIGLCVVRLTKHAARTVAS